MNTVLSETLQTKEKQCWANAQYSRRECLEISGIPSSLSGKDLEDVVYIAITKAGVEVSDKDIEDCHQVGKRGQTIVMFCKRKMSKQVLRKDLTKLSMENFQMLTKVYALTTEYCDQRVNFYIKWIKFVHITCQMVP